MHKMFSFKILPKKECDNLRNETNACVYFINNNMFFENKAYYNVTVENSKYTPLGKWHASNKTCSFKTVKIFKTSSCYRRAGCRFFGRPNRFKVRTVRHTRIARMLILRSQVALNEKPPLLAFRARSLGVCHNFFLQKN
jgi:hypothetical protein